MKAAQCSEPSIMLLLTWQIGDLKGLDHGLQASEKAKAVGWVGVKRHLSTTAAAKSGLGLTCSRGRYLCRTVLHQCW
jgi:hypothetical protein